MPQASGAEPVRQCWWDATRGLGVCGDFLGGNGVEGAWQSAQALIEEVSRDVAAAAGPPGSPPIGRTLQRAAA